ncbi:aldehyde reductase [Microthyrium microscopicum]|uniref:Aldehyde reductase n=1 Tax=Microthyrium microscopicum TaxID=703497 RepID=A0A6A6UI40_9PEZI|nr:aldehyde reductase [Microthyrium microscopicum]
MSRLSLSIGTSAFGGTETQAKVLDVVKDAGIKEVDTAQMYADGKNEVDIGNAGAAERGLSVSTKNPGGFFGDADSLEPGHLKKTAKESLEKLKVKQIDIFYIHAPDRKRPIETWLPTIDELHKEGLFKRFGVSNFSPEEVRAVYDFQKSKGYVLPTVYQGNYNPVARKIDTLLFPTLRELGICFYAYSPLAGGFLAKTRQQIEESNNAGRFADNDAPINKMYRSMYVRPQYLEALDDWGKAAEEEGCTKYELAYRWVYYHSSLKPDLGDHLIMGASKIEQIQSSVDGLKKGPLKSATVKAIEKVWDDIKDVAAHNNFDFFI